MNKLIDGTATEPFNNNVYYLRDHVNSATY